MKILFVINSLKSRSGSERVAVDLANNLAKINGNEISIANRDTNVDEVAYNVNSNVDILKFSGNYLIFFSGLRAYIKEKKYDFVVVHNMGKLSLLCLWFSDLVKIISLEHSSFISRPLSVRLLSKFFYKKIYKVIVLTKREDQIFSSIHHSVIRIPNFSLYYDSSRYFFEKKSNIILSMGRLDDNKNIIHILQAWLKKREILKNWELHIYGDGDQKNKLMNFVDDNNLSNIKFKGVTSEPDQVYKQASFFIMSSKFEGLPMVLIEAQCFGLPIVSYDCPCGPSDIISDGENGFLVQNQDIDSLANSLERLVQSKDLLNTFSKKSLLNASNYEADKILNIWMDLFSQG